MRRVILFSLWAKVLVSALLPHGGRRCFCFWYVTAPKVKTTPRATTSSGWQQCQESSELNTLRSNPKVICVCLPRVPAVWDFHPWVLLAVMGDQSVEIRCADLCALVVMQPETSMNRNQIPNNPDNVR